MNALVPFQQGGPPAALSGYTGPSLAGAAQENLNRSFCVVKYKGSKWALRFGGETETLLLDNGAPMPFLDSIIVGVSPYISKTYYEKKFSEGDDASPDCFSMDGIKPDIASPKKQAASCANCPMNVFGSRISDNGKKAKACQDNRIIAIVPTSDPLNESYGGPMMLRVPPMSLPNLAAAGRTVQRFGGDFHMVSMRLAFDYNVAYPLITFTPQGWLDNDTGQVVAGIIAEGSDQRRIIDQILSTPDHELEEPSPLANGAPPAAFQQPAQAPVQQPAPAAPVQPVVQQPMQAAPAPAPQPVQQPAQAAPAGRGGGFGRRQVAQQPAAAQPVQQPAQAPQQGGQVVGFPQPVQAAPVQQPVQAAPSQPASDVPPAGATTTVVNAAGPDLSKMIDDLL